MSEKGIRIFMAILGVTICGISVGLFKLSLFGTDPFQCFVAGIYNLTGDKFSVSFGTLYMCLNLLMLIIIFILDKHYIGIATFINIFLLGYLVDFTIAILTPVFGNAGLLTRIILLVLGIVIMCFASSLYFTANLGVSTYDAVALIMTDKKIGKFQYCRIGADLFCVIIGFVLKAAIGVGTLVTAFFMGPLIEWFNVHFSRPFLEKWAGEQLPQDK